MFLKTITPLKSIKGKLNFLKQQNPQILSILSLANSLKSSNKQSQINDITLQQINSLQTHQPINQNEYKKLIFEINVHKHSNPSQSIGSIYEQLGKQQKRKILALLKLTDKLNTRQLLYLNYLIRKKIINIFPNWQTIHFNKEAPYRNDFSIIPLLSQISKIQNLKASKKKQVLSGIRSTEKKQAQSTQN